MPAPDMPPVVTLTETQQLYWFRQGGAITGGNVRQRLRRGWGFCPRHTWLLFCVEDELRYLPIGAAKLYQDLTWHATVLLGQHHTVTQLRRALEPQASCLTCDYLAHAPSEDAPSPKAERGQPTQPGSGGGRPTVERCGSSMSAHAARFRSCPHRSTPSHADCT